LRVAIIFILNDLGIVEPATHHQGPQERRVGHGCVSPGNPSAIKLGLLARLHGPDKAAYGKDDIPVLKFRGHYRWTELDGAN
jgi:hypothetical protein